MGERFSEVRAFGTPAADWPAMPLHYGVPEVASEYLRHRVAVLVRGAGLTPAKLAEEIGGEAGTWRSKLNGTRHLSLDELVALAMLVPDLLHDSLPSRSSPVGEWLPESYRGLVAGEISGARLPTFGAPEVGWSDAASALDSWLLATVRDGLEWTVDHSVLVHEVVGVLDRFGLPRRDATPDGAGTDVVQLRWLVHDVTVRVMWLCPFDRPDTESARLSLGRVASELWRSLDVPAADNVLVVAAAPTVLSSVQRTLEDAAPPKSVSGDSGRASHLSVREAHRLHLRGDPLELGDRVVRDLSQPRSGIGWFAVKAG